MNPPKCSTRLYVEFLLVSDRRFSGVELSRVAPDDLSHDAVSHFLQREDLSPKDLWKAVRPRVRAGGVLILDDTVFEKRWSRENPLVHRRNSSLTGKPPHEYSVIASEASEPRWVQGARSNPHEWVPREEIASSPARNFSACGVLAITAYVPASEQIHPYGMHIDWEA